MAKSKKISEQEQVTDFISNLDAETGKITEAVRQIFLKADKYIGERIKWNNPSFYYKGK